MDTLSPALQLLLQQALQSFQRGDNAVADSMLRRVLKIDTKNLPALHVLGLIKASEQRYEEAAQFLSKAARINPNDASIQYNLAKSLADGGYHEQSLPHHKKAAALAPNNPSVWLNFGKSSSNLKHHVEALDYYSNALRLQPDLVEGWFNIGSTLHELKRYEEALRHFEQALNLNSNYLEALINKAFTLHELKQFNEAISTYDKVIDLDPGNILANWNKSLTLLHLGDYENGWPLYEWRWKTELQKYSYRKYSTPLWLGKESLKGKTILVWSEQGLGDTIQFCRYIKIIANLGAKVLFEVQEPLVSALFKLEGTHQVLKLGDEHPEFDFHIPLLSIPFALKTTVRTIPKSTAYISPLPEKINYWKTKLIDKAKIKVGLVWSGGHRSDTSEPSNYSDRKNIPLKMFSALKELNLEFHSLQKGANAELQLAQLESESWLGPKIISHTHELNDFSDTAALIENLDVVISVDTAVAHLAGAMGKPVWVLTNYVVDWRWSDGQRESWYPTARVFSQPLDGDWVSVLDRIRLALIKLGA